MSRFINRRAIIGVWLVVLVAVAGAGAASGVSTAASTSVLWLVACLAPPVVMLIVWRGAPQLRVAEVVRSTGDAPRVES